MSRTPANITQADVARAIRAAKKAGASCVDVMISGTTVRIYLDAAPGDAPKIAPELSPFDQWKAAQHARKA